MTPQPRKGELMARKGNRSSEIISRLVEIGAQRLVEEAELNPERARFLMRQIAHAVSTELGGDHVYWPRDPDFPLELRDLQIWQRFTGHNTDDLARQFDLTPRQVRYICAEMRKRAIRENQAQLPGFESP